MDQGKRHSTALGSSAAGSVRRAGRRFRRDEDGGMIFFGLIILLIMLFAGGMAVDLMRYESERTRIQATADAAALAAASMRQTRDATEIVEDWFDRADLSHALTRVVPDTTSLNYRRVRVETRTTTRPYFMHMMGINELSAAGQGSAEERRTNVEISLVLDVSGSMDGTRIQRLRSAAVEFVENTLADDTEERVSISLVPYNGQVDIGPNLITKYNVTQRHNNSYCVDLPPSVYGSESLSRTTPMPQHVHADMWNTSGTNGYSTGSMAPEAVTNRWCMNNANNRVRVLSNNVNDLRTQINNLTAIGATSIDAGLRWGAALIDPEAQSVVNELASQGVVNTRFRGRPFEYDDPEALKVIVLMTDGEHFPNEYIADDYRTGNSVIYKHTDGNYSIYHASRTGTDKFWIPHKGAWRSHRWAGESCNSQGRNCTYTVPSGSGTPLTWTQVWNELRVNWVAYQLYVRAIGGTLAQRMDQLRVREGVLRTAPTPHDAFGMDSRLLELCGHLKARNVAIFGIAFEAPARGTGLIRDCSSPGRFFDVNGLDISTAFRNIRAQISALRLTQ